MNSRSRRNFSRIVLPCLSCLCSVAVAMTVYPALSRAAEEPAAIDEPATSVAPAPDPAVKDAEEPKARVKDTKKAEAEDEKSDDIVKQKPMHTLPPTFRSIPRLTIIEDDGAQSVTPSLNLNPVTKPLPDETTPPEADAPYEEPFGDIPAERPAGGSRDFIGAGSGEAFNDLEMEQPPASDEADAASSEPAPDTRWSIDRMPRLTTETVRWATQATREDMKNNAGSRVSDTLSELPGVWVLYDSPRVNTLSLHGQGPKSVGLYLDGVRLSSPAFYVLGGGLGMDIIEPETLQSVEILHGANTLKFGSGAVGGLVYGRTRDTAVKNGFGGGLTLKLATSDSSAGLRAHLDGRIGRFGWVVGGGAATHDDIVAGRTLGEQHNTAYDSYHGDAKLSFDFSKDARIVFATQYSTLKDAGLYPQVRLDYRNSDTIDTFDRSFSYLAYEQADIARWLPWLRLAASLQYLSLDRHYVDASTPTLRTEDHNSVFTIGLDFDMALSAGKWSRFSLGASYYRDTIGSKNTRVSLTDDTSVDQTLSLPDGAVYETAGAWLSDEIQPIKGLIFNLGGRYDYIGVNGDWVTRDENDRRQQVSLDSSTWDMNFGGGLAYSWNDIFVIWTDIAQAMRAPTLDEMAAYGWHEGTVTTWLTPNADLKPEKSINTEVGLRLSLPFLKLSASYFFTYLTDAVVVDYTHLQFVNSDHARYIQGVEAEATVIVNEFSVRGTYAYTRGTEGKDTPIDAIPPHHGAAFFKWEHERKKGWVEAYTFWAASQGRLSIPDKLNPFIPAKGTPAWYTLNLRGGLRFGEWGEVSAAFTNILDRSYRTHGSSLSMPGRGLDLRVSLWF